MRVRHVEQAGAKIRAVRVRKLTGWRLGKTSILYAPVAEQADAPASKAASLCRFDSCLAHHKAVAEYVDAPVMNGGEVRRAKVDPRWFESIKALCKV